MSDWGEVLRDADVLRDAASNLSFLLSDSTPNDTTLAEVAQVIADLDDARRDMGDVITMLQGWASLLMETDEVTLPDFFVERKWAKSRTQWDNDLLRRDVVNSIRASTEPDAVEPETGELTHSWEQIVGPLMEAYYLSGSNVRVTWLKEHGLAAGDYCEESKWKPKVQITRRSRNEHDDATADG